MANYFPCAVYVGGAVPETLLPELAEAINASGGGPDWGSSPYRLSADEIADAAGAPFPILDDQANFGAMRPLEMFLLNNRIDFDRLSSASTDTDAFLLKGRTVDGHYTSIETLSTSDGEPALVADDLKAIMAKASSFEVATEEISRALGTHIPDLVPLVVVERSEDPK